MQKDTYVVILSAHAAIGEPELFHMNSKKMAEKYATTPIYIIADDDCLILGRDFIKNGISVMQQNPAFGMIGAWNITDDAPLGLISSIGQSIVEKQCGGVVFVRKGILTDFEDRGADKVDGSLADEMKRKSFKVGVSIAMRFNHLGSGYSTTTKGCWEA